MTTPEAALRRNTRTSGSSRPISVVLVLTGLFTVSWDRFLAVEVFGSYQLKVTTSVFAVALITLTVDSFGRRGNPIGPLPFFVPLAAAVTALMLIPGWWAADKRSLFFEVLAAVVKALVPALVTYLAVKRHHCLDQALTAFIRGGYTAAAFGLYQLLAFYTGLPQGIVYTARNGEFGRISAFNYEAGYFSYFILLVIAAFIARSRLREQTVPLPPLVFFMSVLMLAGSRAVWITVPVFVGLLMLRAPTARMFNRLAAATAVAALGVTVIALAMPDQVTSLVERTATIVDPREETSNAPRLEVLSVARSVIAENPWGVGAGNFFVHASPYAAYASIGNAGSNLVANNIWAQALLDGGWLLLAGEIIFCVAVITRYFAKRHPVARVLMAGWLTVVLIGGLVTSYFFDEKLWVVLALAAAAVHSRSNQRSAQPVHQSPTRSRAATATSAAVYARSAN